MKNFEQISNWYNEFAATYTSEQRKSWYSEVADAYNKARPRYSKELINRAVELAQLSKDAIILEVGCGPGTATTSFAEMGFSLVCIEPSQEASLLAKHNCASYPTVEIQNTTFEEWSLETDRFNAILAATSWHWMPPEIKYTKAKAALKANGSLILLWNMTPQLPYEVYQALDNEVYQIHTPSLARYENREAQQEILREVGQNIIDSEKFKNLVSEQLVCEVTYSIDDYLMLLSTFSHYRVLEPQKQEALFNGLREVLERHCGGSIPVSYLSAFHVAQKI